MRSKKCKALIVASAALLAAPAFATCPSMGTYSVSGITLQNVTLGEAVDAVVDSTAWKAEVSDPTNAVLVSMRDVSGPMDMVLEKLIRQSGTASGASIAVRRDTNTCTVKFTVNARPSATVEIPSLVEIQTTGEASGLPPVAPAARELPPVTLEHTHGMTVPVSIPLPREVHQLPAGKFLSAALNDYAEKEGWKLRWLIPTDYMLDVEVPLPKADFKENIIWLVETYQMQGGLLGTRPRFTSNRVFVLEPMRPDGDEK